MTPEQWIVGDDTGVSSKTIWAVMMGAVSGQEPWYAFDVPHDPDDFGRCYRLLKAIPEWRPRLHEVAERFPKWAPLIAAWDELTALYEEEVANGKPRRLCSRAPKLYERMRQLRP